MHFPEYSAKNDEGKQIDGEELGDQLNETDNRHDPTPSNELYQFDKREQEENAILIDRNNINENQSDPNTSNTIQHLHNRTEEHGEIKLGGTVAAPGASNNQPKPYPRRNANRVWRCMKCPHKATSQFGLKRHLKKEHRDILPSCTICGKVVRDVAALKQHLKRMHQITIDKMPAAPRKTESSSSGPQQVNEKEEETVEVKAVSSTDETECTEDSAAPINKSQHPDESAAATGDTNQVGAVPSIDQTGCTEDSAAPSNKRQHPDESVPSTADTDQVGAVPSIDQTESTGDSAAPSNKRQHPDESVPSTVDTNQVGAEPSVDRIEREEEIGAPSNKRRRLDGWLYCPHCEEYETKSAEKLKKHIHYKHNEDMQFPCPLCNRHFTEKVLLNQHVERYHTNRPEKVYECPTCSYKAKSKYGYKRHLWQHNDVLPFCAMCNRVFVDATALDQHHLQFQHNGGANKVEETNVTHTET